MSTLTPVLFSHLGDRVPLPNSACTFMKSTRTFTIVREHLQILRAFLQKVNAHSDL